MPLKGCNIVDLDFVYKDYLMGINLATPHYLTLSKRKIDRAYKHFIPLTIVKTSSYDVNALCATDTYSKFML